MVGVDHELGGDVREVGDVAFEAGKGACLGFQGPVDTLGGAGELDEPVAFDRGLAGDGLLGLGDLFVDAVQGAPSPVRPVLVVDDLVAALILGAGRQGWVKMCPSGICSSGCSWRHAWTTYGTSGIRAQRMNDNPADPSPASVSKYKVDTSQRTSDAGPRSAVRAHAAADFCRQDSFANAGRRRLRVAYAGGSKPASSTTRRLSSLLVGLDDPRQHQ